MIREAVELTKRVIAINGLFAWRLRFFYAAAFFHWVFVAVIDTNRYSYF
jgi:hypothetical protein